MPTLSRIIIPSFCFLILIVAIGCQHSEKGTEGKASDLFMDVEGSMDKYFYLEDTLEVLAEGFIWSEGPVWVPELNGLLFTDVPSNVIHLWQEGIGLSTYLTHAGFPEDDSSRHNTGANGLALNADRKLVICQHGYRQLAIMNTSLEDPRQEFVALATQYNGARFNSPNDLCIDGTGNIIFTDPPYGLENPEAQEIDFFGLYKWYPSGKTILLIDSLTRPNGVALSPDEQILYVAVSDPEHCAYYAYTYESESDKLKGGLLFNATHLRNEKHTGLPDGLKVHPDGTIFATGPGGVLLLSSDGKHIGSILTGQSAANLAFDTDYRYLYITAHERLLRIRLKSRG
jgi:gluconolactonase